MKTLTGIFAAAMLSLASVVASYAQEQNPRIFAHRGGRYEFDENTMSAFKSAYEAGYTGFEIDIRMTKDGELVLMHDGKVDRTVNGTGAVEDLTAAQLRSMKTKKGNDIAFLDEFVKWLDGKDGMYVEFEMKTKSEKQYPEERLREYCDKLYKAVKSAKCTNSLLVFTSFDCRSLRYLQFKYPDAVLGLITSKPCSDATIDLCKSMGIKRLAVNMNGSSRAAVKKAHDAGISVVLWPGKKVEDLLLAVYLGSKYICCDIPVQAKEYIGKNCPALDITY